MRNTIVIAIVAVIFTLVSCWGMILAYDDNGTPNAKLHSLTVGDLTASTGAVSDLTSGRVVLAGTSGELQDDADLSFSTDTLTATKIGAFTATGPIDFDSQTLSNASIASGSITGTDISTSPGETLTDILQGAIRVVKGSLTSGDTNDLAFAWHNPNDNDLFVIRVIVEITTPEGTGSPVMDVGLDDDGDGVNIDTSFFDGIDLTATTIYDSFADGEQTEYVVCQEADNANDSWIVGKILTADADDMLGNYYIQYMDKEQSADVDTGSVYYVDDDGSSGDGSFGDPWETIQEAADVLVPGDTVYIMAGTYTEQVTPANSGSADAWITYTNYPGHSPVIDASGLNLSGQGVFYINAKSYIKVNGLTIQDGDYGSVLIDGVRVSSANGSLSNVEVTNCTISNMNHCAIWVGAYASTYTCTNIKVYNNDIDYASNVAQDENITFCYVSNFEISYNNVNNSSTDRIGIDCKHANHGGSIHHNTLPGDGVSNAYGIYLDTYMTNATDYTSDINIYSNTVSSYGGGIGVVSEDNTGYFADINIYSNTVSSNGSGIRLISYQPGVVDYTCDLYRVKVYGNTISSNTYGLHTGNVDSGYFHNCVGVSGDSGDGCTITGYPDNTYTGNTTDIYGYSTTTADCG